MEIAAKLMIGIVAAFHLYILWLEMFAWTSKGPKTFKNFDKELFPKTKALAANQGLYNGFLAAGLIWSFFIRDPHWQTNIALFFLSCVAVAGIYGAFTADKKIFFVQALPALIGIGILLLVPKKETIAKSATAETTYYYLSSSRQFVNHNPVPKSEVLQQDPKDSIIAQSSIRVGNKDLGVFLLTNENHEFAIDANSNSGYVEGIGTIYAHSITWRNFGVLQTNNDSINRIITLALARLITLETKHFRDEYYQYGRGTKERIEFKKPDSAL